MITMIILIIIIIINTYTPKEKKTKLIEVIQKEKITLIEAISLTKRKKNK